MTSHTRVSDPAERAHGPLSVWAVALLISAVACEDDPPFPSGNLLRPSGLSFVERPARTATTREGTVVELRRSDLLVADGEAQGVRVIQFSEQLEFSEDLQRDVRVSADPFFVPAPSAFFSLAVDAPGFPSSIQTATIATESVPRRAYVLSPASAELHALEVGDIAFRAPATVETNVRVGSADLLSGVAALGLNLIPVDFVWLGRRDDGAFDRVAVAYDSLGEGSGRLVLFEIGLLQPSALSAIDVVELPIGTSDLVYRPEEQVILVASLTEPTVSEVTLSGRPGSLSFRFEALRTIDVLGPITRLVDAGDTGLFGLRSDRSAAVWLRPGSSGFALPDVTLTGPYDPISPDQQVSERGVLTLRSPLAVVGGHAVLNRAAVPGDIDDAFFLDSATPHDVVLLVHADGIATYIVRDLDPTLSGAVPRIAVGSGGVSVQTLFSSDATSLGAPVLETVAAVPTSTSPLCSETLTCPPETLSCDLESSTRRSFVGQFPLRVSPFGRLRLANAAALNPSVNEGTLELVDAGLSDFDDFALRVGDRAELDLELANCAGQDVDVVVTATLTAVGVGIDTRGAAARSGAAFRVGGLTVLTSSPAIGRPDLYTLCPDALAALNQVRTYEVYVDDGTPEAVLAQVVGRRVVRVFERRPLVTQSSLGQERTFAEFGTGGRSNLPFFFAVAGPSVTSGEDPLADLRCTRRSATDGDETLGPCFLDVDCGLGRVCSDPTPQCPGTCDAECLVDCFNAETTRVCPSLDLTVAGPRVEVDLRFAGPFPTGDALVGAGSVPGDVIFHPHRASFFVSFPGSRSIVEVPTDNPNASLQGLR